MHEVIQTHFLASEGSYALAANRAACGVTNVVTADCTRRIGGGGPSH